MGNDINTGFSAIYSVGIYATRSLRRARDLAEKSGERIYRIVTANGRTERMEVM